VHTEAAEFPEALRRLPRGVSVITFGEAGKRFGLTATSVSSLSRDPPTILVSVDRSSAISQEFLASSAFGISVLAADHNALADRFLEGARIADWERRHVGLWVAPASGVPLLAEAVAAFDCELDDIMECHGYAIVVGRVRGVRAPGKSSALVYWRGAYNQLGWTEDEISRAVGLKPIRPGATTY
jgi:flavin reductase (DIM6/NTAB) family NADH-FMN oxidoreductase RutF